MATLFKVFKKQPFPTSNEAELPDAVTREANNAVKKILEEKNGASGRKQKYTHFTPEARAKIMKYVAQCGNAATVKHFAKELPTLGESTVCLFKKQYQVGLKKVGSEEEITQLAKKRRGRPLTLGNLDEKVQQYIKAFRKAGTPVNARVVLAATEGIVKATDRTLLFENGGHIKLSLNWACSLLRRMGYVKRKATTITRTALTQEEFAAVKKRYLRQIKKAVKDAKIPPELVINWD